MTKNEVLELSVAIRLLALFPMLAGFFYKLGLLYPLKLDFLISSYSYIELALSSYSSIFVILYAALLLILNFITDYKTASLNWMLMWICGFLIVCSIVLSLTFGFDRSFLIFLIKIAIALISLVFILKSDKTIIKISAVVLGISLTSLLDGYHTLTKIAYTKSQPIKAILKDNNNYRDDWRVLDKSSEYLILININNTRKTNYEIKIIKLENIDKFLN